MATVLSESFDLRSGSGSISLTHDSLVNEYSFKVSDIGSISIDFDLEEDSDDASNVFFDLGSFEFTVFDGLTNGDSFFKKIDAIPSTDKIKVQFNFTTADGRSWTDVFYFSPSDMEYDYLGRNVKIESSPKLSVDGTIQDYFNSNQQDVDILEKGNPDLDCMSSNLFINNVLNDINSSNQIINRSFAFYKDGKNDSLFTEWVITYQYLRASVPPYLPDVVETDALASDAFFRLAAGEGSIVGSAMGYNFFANRLDTTGASIDIGQVENLNIKPGINSYYGVKCIFRGTGFSSVNSQIGVDDNLNEEASRTLNVYFASPQVNSASWDDGNQKYVPIDSDGSSKIDIYLKEDYSEGSNVLLIEKDGGGDANIILSERDVIWFNDDYAFSYEVFSQSASQLVLREPLRKDLKKGSQAGEWELFSRDFVSRRAANCYSSAYGANGSRRIDITVFGVDTIKPYEAFTLDSGFPSLIQGQTYRPSKLEYDFVGDKINIEAYQVS